MPTRPLRGLRLHARGAVATEAFLSLQGGEARNSRSVFMCFLHFHARVSDPSRAKQENTVEIREKPENIFWVSKISLFSQFLAFPRSREGGPLRVPEAEQHGPGVVALRGEG